MPGRELRTVAPMLTPSRGRPHGLPSYVLQKVFEKLVVPIPVPLIW